MPVIADRMKISISGQVTRELDSVKEPNKISAAMDYGLPVKMRDGAVQPLEAGDVSADIYGFICRPYPSTDQEFTFGTSRATDGQLVDVLRSGYMGVKLISGSAVRGGQVYATLAPSGGNPVGSITASTAGAIAVPGCTFMGEAGGDGMTEICYNI